MEPVKDESTAEVLDFLLNCVPLSVREQVQYVTVDTPSNALFVGIQQACPNFVGMYIDEVHLPIVYNTAFWRKPSPGQTALRRVQAKFTVVDPHTPASHLG